MLSPLAQLWLLAQAAVVHEHHHPLMSLLHTQNLIIQKETQLFCCNIPAEKQLGTLHPPCPSSVSLSGPQHKFCDGCYWGAQQGLQPHHHQNPSPSISASWKPASKFSETLELWRGFCYWESVRYPLLYKKRKCHKKARELLRLPPAARSVPGHSKHRETHWFCLWHCSDRSIWRMLKPLDQAPVLATALSSSAYVNLPATTEVFVQGSGWISP